MFPLEPGGAVPLDGHDWLLVAPKAVLAYLQRAKDIDKVNAVRAFSHTIQVAASGLTRFGHASREAMMSLLARHMAV